MDYKSQFIKELKDHSLKRKARKDPANTGCVHELKDIEKIDIKNAKDLAKLIKERIHLMYQKDTAKRVLDALLENL